MAPQPRPRPRGRPAPLGTETTPSSRHPWHAAHVDLRPSRVAISAALFVLLAGVGSVVAERLAARTDSASTLRLALALIALGFVVIGVGVRGEGAFGAFVAGVACYGLGLGANDAASNMQAVALEHRLG